MFFPSLLFYLVESTLSLVLLATVAMLVHQLT